MRILILSNLDWPSVDALTRLRPQLMQDEVTVMLSKRVGRVPAASKPYLAELSPVSYTHLTLPTKRVV